jgi:hypothetical protein
MRRLRYMWEWNPRIGNCTSLWTYWERPACFMSRHRATHALDMTKGSRQTHRNNVNTAESDFSCSKLCFTNTETDLFSLQVINQRRKNCDKPVTAAAGSKAWTVFVLSNTGIVGSNPTQGMCVCLRLFCVCIGSGFATGWSPVQGVLNTVLGLRNWSETKRFMDALCSKWEQQEKEREYKPYR